MSKKILVTGANGLVGSALKEISHAWPEYTFIFVSRKDGDLTNQNDVKKIFNSYEPLWGVIHTAARVGGIGRNLNSPVEQFNDNVLMNSFIIKEAHEHNVQNLIAFSSVCVFPASDEILSEENMHNGPPFSAHHSYAMAKRMVDVQIEAYRKQYKRNYCSVIPTNIYGKNDYYNLENGHVVPTLIRKFYNALNQNTNVECWGDGSPIREFIYAEDLARMCILLINKESMPQKIITPGYAFSIKDLVDRIHAAYHKVYHDKSSVFTLDINWNKDKPNGQLVRKTNSTEFKKLIPGFLYSDIDRNLEESIKWFLENYPNVRL